MYSTCIFCHSALGKNEAVEHFPVGRRLAFDGAKGRLWVVCSKCGRWNLTPLEERWEAIEECERHYRDTIKRSSTEQIGLGRIKEGTDLIRIGQPLRPEFAAWRYGRHFKQRRRHTQGLFAFGLASYIGLAFIGGPLSPLMPSVISLVIGGVMKQSEIRRAQRIVTRRAEAGFGRRMWKHDRIGIRIISSDAEQGWGLRFALDGKFLDYHGRDAVHTAHLIAPAINAQGGSPSDVLLAVREIEIAGSADRYFTKVLKFGESKGWHYTGLPEYPGHMRLAFEMAAHEETERAAMEGELAQLEDDWSLRRLLLLPTIFSCRRRLPNSSIGIGLHRSRTRTSLAGELPVCGYSVRAFTRCVKPCNIFLTVST
ncbi:MAG: hypothetical protein ABIQ55_07980 [Gemmatimonadaceae bacterium]